MELSSLFPFFFLKKMLSTFLCTTLTQILCVVHMAHRSLFCRICTKKPCCDSKLTASVYILTAVWIHGHDSMLSLLVLPDSSSLLLIRVPSCSQLQLFRCPYCAHPGFWYQYQICSHKILRVLETSWGFGDSGFSSPVPWTHCIHSSSYPDPQNRLHSLTKVEFLVSFCFNLIVNFISQQLPFYSFSFLCLRIACISSFLTFSF